LPRIKACCAHTLPDPRYPVMTVTGTRFSGGMFKSSRLPVVSASATLHLVRKEPESLRHLSSLCLNVSLTALPVIVFSFESEESDERTWLHRAKAGRMSPLEQRCCLPRAARVEDKTAPALQVAAWAAMVALLILYSGLLEVRPQSFFRIEKEKAAKAPLFEVSANFAFNRYGTYSSLLSSCTTAFHISPR
jgi:hypothetical protein